MHHMVLILDTKPQLAFIFGKKEFIVIYGNGDQVYLSFSVSINLMMRIIDSFRLLGIA